MDCFHYPLDTETLLRKKRKLRRELLAQNPHPLHKKIAILGGSTTNEVADQLGLFLLQYGIEAEFYQSEYAQYWQDAMFGTPELDDFHPDVIYIHTNWRNLTALPTTADSEADIDAMLERVDKNTILVACMMVNNEIGTRNDVERLAAEVKRRNSRTIVHVDAVQAWMRVPIKLDNIDTLAVSGHKIHAPKGIGALYLSDRLVQAFQPPYLGGEQERQMRPGTENLPYAMGLAAAATRLAKTMKSRDTAMRALNRQLREGLKAFPEVVINSPENAVPEVLNFSEMCIKSETMLAFLAEEQIYVSSASACGRGQPSHTLAAMGRDPLAIDTAIRVSFCADNTPEDVDAFLNRFEDGMKHLQKIRK